MADTSNRTMRPSIDRRNFIALGAAAGVSAIAATARAETESPAVIAPPQGKKILLSCKLGMLPNKLDGKELSIAERLRMAGEAGFDGVDFDQAGGFI